jgi:glycosyltransferase involved in cell wall biosynthesis/SAM-dependent methyltransferase
MHTGTSAPRIGILVVAYNAQSTLLKTLDRIPVEFRSRIDEIIICDDSSSDGTAEIGVQWATRPDTPKTHVLRHTKNLGYGGNQKAGYALAIEHRLDIVVLLHGDGQYAPECLPDMIAPFEDSDCAAVFGSRMMRKGAAKLGGMPLYKRWGNRVLTHFENGVLGTNLTEFHSGYRAYRTRTLEQIQYTANSDGFDFDTQIIAQVLHAGGRIVEVPIPTYYGDEICYVNGVQYARDVVFDVLKFKLAVRGFGTSEWVPSPDEYAIKKHDGSSHAVMLEMLSARPPSKILDLACSSGLLAEQMRASGHCVIGVDLTESPEVRRRTDAFFAADLNDGIPAEAGVGFDVVVAGDVIEHLLHPGDSLRHMQHVLRPGGQVLLSVPNFAHWYPRLRVALGLFGYDRRGILDETHLRFFTRSSLRRLTRDAGFDILEETATGLPVGAVLPPGPLASFLRSIDKRLVQLRPTLFGYQYVLRLTSHAEETVHFGQLSTS